jgi:hypothetical protein
MAKVVDGIVGRVAAKILPESLLTAIKSSPMGNFSLSNALSSQADVFVQVLHTQGVTHAANITLVPCSKVELKVTGQVGGDAQLLGLTPGASRTKDIFTKTFTRWNPASNFCKSI